MIRFYGYDGCSTCRKAKKILAQRQVSFEDIDITKNPPPKNLLSAILASGAYMLSELFNRSGQLYRELNMKEKLKTMSEAELLDLLAKHGRLVKRPLVTDGKTTTIGLDEDRFGRAWCK